MTRSRPWSSSSLATAEPKVPKLQPPGTVIEGSTSQGRAHWHPAGPPSSSVPSTRTTEPPRSAPPDSDQPASEVETTPLPQRATAPERRPAIDVIDNQPPQARPHFSPEPARVTSGRRAGGSRVRVGSADSECQDRAARHARLAGLGTVPSGYHIVLRVLAQARTACGAAAAVVLGRHGGGGVAISVRQCA